MRLSGHTNHSEASPAGWQRRAAFTLVETLVAAVVILTALGAIFAVSSRCTGIVRSAQDIAVASAILSERMQQLQASPWEDVTDSESFLDQVYTDPEDGTTENIDGLFKTATRSGSDARLSGIVETVRVSAYRPTPIADPIPAPISARRASNVASLTSAASSLVDEKMVRVDLRLTWTDGRMGLTRSLPLSAIISRK